jgi:hypothetical protein
MKKKLRKKQNQRTGRKLSRPYPDDSKDLMLIRGSFREEV